MYTNTYMKHIKDTPKIVSRGTYLKFTKLYREVHYKLFEIHLISQDDNCSTSLAMRKNDGPQNLACGTGLRLVQRLKISYRLVRRRHHLTRLTEQNLPDPSYHLTFPHICSEKSAHFYLPNCLPVFAGTDQSQTLILRVQLLTPVYYMGQNLWQL